ncbi:MAG: hypothetical protein WCO55_05390 [Candidatus Falkowbacteria bacterium]
MKSSKFWLVLGVAVLSAAFLYLLVVQTRSSDDNQSKKAVEGEKINATTSQAADVFKTIDCTYDPEIHYWSWWEGENGSKPADLSTDEIKTKRQSNLYVSCSDIGTGAIMTAYIFKDGKLIFEQDLYRGYFFRDYKADEFYAISGILNDDANGYPIGYVSARYKLNQNTNNMDLIETKEYKTRDQLNTLLGFIKNRNLHYRFDPNFANATLQSEVAEAKKKEKEWLSKDIDCSCEKQLIKPKKVTLEGEVMATFVSGEHFGLRTDKKIDGHQQFYVIPPEGSDFTGWNSAWVKVAGTITGLTCAYANTVYGECAAEIVADAVKVISF